MRIVLLGGAGFLGVNLAVALIDAGHIVFIVDRACSRVQANRALAGVSGFHDLDVADLEHVTALLDRLAIDCVFNLVSTLLPSSSLDAFASEVAACSLPAYRLIQRVAERGIRYVFFSSGGTIYGNSDQARIAETEPARPINLYAHSKHMLEEYLALMGRVSSLEYLIVRASNPYGPFQNPLRRQGLVAVAFDRVLRGEDIVVWGDGSQVRDFVWVRDVANAVTALLATAPWRMTFNIGSGSGHSVSAVIALIEGVTQRRARLVFQPARATDAGRVVLDIARLQARIPYAPRALEEGLGLYYDSIGRGSA